MKKIRVLIVDDSALVRQTIGEILASDPDIEIMGTAAESFVATKIAREVTDVFDIELFSRMRHLCKVTTT